MNPLGVSSFERGEWLKIKLSISKLPLTTKNPASRVAL